MQQKIKNTVEATISYLMNEFHDICVDQSKCSGHNPELQYRLDKTVDNGRLMLRDIEKHIADNYSGMQKKRLENELKEEFRLGIADYFLQGKLFERVTLKPFGYDGDYVTIESVYNNKPISQGLGMYMDYCFLGHDLANAIRNRKDMMGQRLVDNIKNNGQSARILNLGSGPCREWQENIEKVSNIELLNLDFDMRSHNYAREKLNGHINNNKIEYVEDNVINILKDRNQKIAQGGFDYVYSMGLYDYLKDSLLKKLLTKQLDLLEPDGKMLITFKDCTKYDQTEYDWYTNWLFVQRNQPAVETLLNDIGITSNNYRMHRDSTDVIMFYEIQKR